MNYELQQSSGATGYLKSTHTNANYCYWKQWSNSTDKTSHSSDLYPNLLLESLAWKFLNS